VFLDKEPILAAFFGEGRKLKISDKATCGRLGSMVIRSGQIGKLLTWKEARLGAYYIEVLYP